MGKLKINPDFTGEEVTTNPVSEEEVKDFVKDDDADEGDEEGEKKETSEDDSEEEGDHAGTPPAKKPDGEDEDAVDDDKAARERELQGLKNEETKLDTDLSDLDKAIQETRQRIADKRGDRRAKREESRQAPQEKEEVDLSDVDPADVERVEKILRAKGYMRKDEFEQSNLATTQKQVEDSFYKNNPQYLPAHDTNDELYNALKEEITALGAHPKNAQQAEKVLQFAHAQIVKRFPSKFPKSAVKPSDAATRTRMNLAGTGAGSPGSSARKGKSQSSMSAEDRQTLLNGGFSPEEIDEM